MMLTKIRGVDPYYDLIDDFDLIVASFTTQYGLRIRDIKDMRWSEFKSLLIGLGPNTILGRIVSIRAEDDSEVLKNFTKDQQRIRNEYRLKKAKRPGNKKEAEKASEMFEKVFWEMAGLNTSELSRQ